MTPMMKAAERQILRDAAARDPASAAAGQHLEAIARLLGESLPQLEVAIAAAAHGPAPLDEASAHLLAAGGKRVRPTACLLMTIACGGDAALAVPVAAAAELVHAATLLHDD